MRPLDSGLVLAGGPVTLGQLNAGRAFLDWLYFEPDGLAHTDIHQWGAFAHVGA